MTLAVLDASALLALMLNEPGGEAVAPYLDGAMISAVNLAEVAAKLLERGASLELVETEIREAEIEVVTFDERHALESARLRPITAEFGLSLGDRACLALGFLSQRTVLTTDREWGGLGLEVDIRLLR